MITIRVLYHFATTKALEIAVSARHAYLIFPFVKLLKEPDLGQDLLKAVVHQRVENFSQVLLFHFWIWLLEHLDGLLPNRVDGPLQAADVDGEVERRQRRMKRRRRFVAHQDVVHHLEPANVAADILKETKVWILKSMKGLI